MSAGGAGVEHDDVASTKNLNHKGHEGTRRKTKISPRRRGDTEKNRKEQKLAADCADGRRSGKTGGSGKRESEKQNLTTEARRRGGIAKVARLPKSRNLKPGFCRRFTLMIADRKEREFHRGGA